MRVPEWLENLKKERGVSPIIAGVMTIALVIAIALIVYAWTTGFASGKSGAESTEAEYIVIEYQNLSGGTLKIAIRNSSNTVVWIDSLYKNGMLYNSGLDWKIDINKVIETELPSGYSVSKGDEIMLVTRRGTRVEFKVIG
jgi:FlaG/FlaF family flagellin (archaellin)